MVGLSSDLSPNSKSTIFLALDDRFIFYCNFIVWLLQWYIFPSSLIENIKQFNLNPPAHNNLLVLKFYDLLNPKHCHLVATVVLWNTPYQGNNENRYTNENGLSSLSEKYYFEAWFEILKQKGLEIKFPDICYPIGKYTNSQM